MSKSKKPPLYIDFVGVCHSAYRTHRWRLLTAAGTLLGWSKPYMRPGDRTRAAQRVADEFGLTIFGGD